MKNNFNLFSNTSQENTPNNNFSFNNTSIENPPRKKVHTEQLTDPLTKNQTLRPSNYPDLQAEQYFGYASEQKPVFSLYPSLNEQSDIIKAVKVQTKPEKQQITCRHKNSAKHLCMNPECQNYVIICQEQFCECRKQHELCAMIFIQGVKNKINSRITSLNQVKEQLTSEIQKTCNRLNDFKSILKQQLSQGQQTFGMAQNEKTLLKAFQSGNLNNIKGKDIKTIISNNPQQIDGKSIKDKFLQNGLTQLQELNQKVGQSIHQIIQFLQDFKEQAYTSSLPFVKLSKVIRTQEDQKRIKRFFTHRPISGAKLLYCASEYQFSVQWFHQSCDGFIDTLTICQTEHGKIIGGYTPISWISEKEDVFDPLQQSFIFSLSNNHKFTLVQGRPAICRRKKQGPFFGNPERPDLCICDEANQNSKSFSYTNQSYHHPEYTAGKRESFQKFNGSDDKFNFKSFKIKEWEVWQLIFKN